LCSERESGRTSAASIQRPTIASVIITRNRVDMLRKTLNSLRASTYPISEFVVSDDSKDDSTQRFLAAEFPDVRCIPGPRQGISSNRNCGMSVVRADYILLTDDDIEVDSHFVEHAMELIRDRKADMVFAPIQNQGEKIQPNAVSFLGFSTRPYRAGEPYHTANQQCFLISRELVRRCSYDEVIRAYGYEEIDFAYRVSAAGARIECAEASVNIHLAPDENQVYRPQQEACRMYVMYKRYAYLERKPIRATIFAVAAFSQHLLASLKRERLPGLRTAIDNYRSAWRMLSEYRSSQPIDASGDPLPMQKG